MKLVVDSLNYRGPKDLTQYFIKKTTMIFEEEDERIVVKLKLGRRLIGTILTVFLPTVVMVILSQVTNYFKPFFFESVITVNLTIILVIATMFLAISHSLPTTSVVKMLDLWFILCLLVPFAYVLIHTYMDLLRNYSKEKVEKTEGVEDNEVTSQDHNKVQILKLGRKNSTIKPTKIDQNLVSRDEEAQVNARKQFYQEIEALGKDYKLKFCLTLTKVAFPICISLSMVIYWIVGLVQFFELI